MIPVSLWFVFFAALASIAALITYSIGINKKEYQAGPIGLILLAIVTGLLIIAIFSGIGSGNSNQTNLSGQDFVRGLKNAVSDQCGGKDCKECTAVYAMSKGWNEKECHALQELSQNLESLGNNGSDLSAVFNQLELLRRQIIRKIDSALSGQGNENDDAAYEIIKLAILDRLIQSQLESYFCQAK